MARIGFPGRWFRAALFAALALGGAAEAGPLAVTGAKVGPAPADSPGDERVEILLTDRPDFRLFTLDGPPRAVADLPEAALPTAPVAADPATRLVAGLRFGARGREGARIVIDLRRPARIARAFTEAAPGGARLVLDFAPEGRAAFAALAGWPEAARPPAPPPPETKAEGLLVMIDPGHGGADPGAISRGVAEKDVALDYARALAAAIGRKPGLRAALSREGDEYVSLRERVARARAAGAAAFLSIHADSLANGDAEGASIYLLSETASDAEAAELAASHEAGEALGAEAPEAAESDVAKVLVDLALRRAEPRAGRLAALLVERIGEVAPLLPGRALQSAGFRVLRAPEIPSALLELGFLSNAEDRERLLSETARTALAEAVAGAFEIWAEEGAARP